MIEWNQVTWYSKLGAIILFISIVPALCFYIGIQYQLAQQSFTSPPVINGANPVLNSGVFGPYDGNSFSYKSNPVSPFCLGNYRDQWNSTNGGTRIDLEQCYAYRDTDMANSSEVDTTTAQPFTGGGNSTTTQSVAYKFGLDEYTILGQKGNEYMVKILSNGGGSGYPTWVELIKKEGNILSIEFTHTETVSN